MITGIGIDVIEVARVKKAAEAHPRFLEKIFTAEEIRYSQAMHNKYLHLAARFAAKEAFFKALGRRISWTAVSVVNCPSGKPELVIAAPEGLGFDRASVSLSHITNYGLAMVVLEKD
ncbi:MAG: holo-ACP synthase [Candidatus Aminicenantes bacterium]|nr:holo-ACP synthase [Candidatus Aminicenantes bacterium]